MEFKAVSQSPRESKMKHQPKTAEAVATTTEHPEFGRIFRLTYPDGVKVYLYNKGLIINIPSTHEAVVRHDKTKEEVSIVFSPEELDILEQGLKFYFKVDKKKVGLND